MGHIDADTAAKRLNPRRVRVKVPRYGSQGLTEKPTLIPEVDFSRITASVRAPWLSECMAAKQEAKAAVAG